MNLGQETTFTIVFDSQCSKPFDDKSTIWLKIEDCTVVGAYINKMKTTFHLNFNLYQAFKQHGYTKTWKQGEAVNLKSSL